MEILNKKQKIIIIVIIALVLIFIGYYIITKVSNLGYTNLETQENENTSNEDNTNEEMQERNNIENNEEVSLGSYIIVHVTGAVKKQGIVEIEEGSRISDVIEAAGGTTKKADLSKINLAYIVQDGQKIYVPSIDDKEEVSSVTQDAGEKVIKDDGQSVSTRKEKININTASQTELETLNGIGPSTALKIINYREQNGKFKTIEDVKNVPGIGDSKYENIKENICV